jgi:hypothetical protein
VNNVMNILVTKQARNFDYVSGNQLLKIHCVSCSWLWFHTLCFKTQIHSLTKVRSALVGLQANKVASLFSCFMRVH